MSKRRVSIRGKGAEILFGAPPAVDLQPRTSDPVLADEATLTSESVLQKPNGGQSASAEGHTPYPSDRGRKPDREFEEALLEEARDSAPIPLEEDGGLLEAEVLPAVTAEIEQAFFQEALVAEEQMDPLTEVPIPTLEVTMEEQAFMQAETFPETSPDSGDALGGVLPPRRAPMVADPADAESLARDIQAPDEKVEWLELPENLMTEEEKQRILATLGQERIRGLDDQIDEMYDQVLAEVGENEQIATECYNLLLKARDILLRYDVARIPQAEYYIEQVRARLKRADESEAGARRMQWWILGWGLLWCAIFLALVLLFTHEWFRNLIAPVDEGSPLVDVPIFLTSAVWGGIGGVVAILYSLFKHVGRRDFDRQFSISYIGKPFLGLILGATVFMVFNLIVRALGMWPAGLEGAPDSLAVAPGVIYLMAWAAGFKENRIFDLMDRIMKRMFAGEKDSQTGSSTESTETAD